MSGGKWAILDHVMNHATGDLSPEVARYLLALDFPPADQARYAELSVKAQEGTLTADERSELEEFLDVGDFLAIMQSKARVYLRKHSSAA